MTCQENSRRAIPDTVHCPVNICAGRAPGRMRHWQPGGIESLKCWDSVPSVVCRDGHGIDQQEEIRIDSEEGIRMENAGKQSADLERETEHYILSQGLVSPGDVVLAGVSGGPDSMAMLCILDRLRERLGFTLAVVHVHHGIRGTEAERDLQQVRNVCGKLDLKLYVFRYDVPDLARRQGTGIEQTGRQVRREAFETVIGRDYPKGRTLIALAHNRNDQAETVLQHLCRGSGLRGLAGIRPRAGNVIHPLLFAGREEIISWLTAEGISFIRDSSNDEDAYTRNRIRHHLVPLLQEEVHPGAVRQIARTADLLAMAEEYLAGKGRKLYDRYSSSWQGIIFINEELLEEPPVLQCYVLRTALETASGRQEDWSLIHIRQMLALMENRCGRQADMGGGIKAVRTAGGLVLGRGDIIAAQGLMSGKHTNRVAAGTGAGSALSETGLPVRIDPGGSVEAEGFVCRARVFSADGQKVCEKQYTKWFDYDKIQSIPVIRTRESGDYLRILPGLQKKKLRRLLIDLKIPAQLRGRLPLIACGSEVIWVVGCRTNDAFRITEKTARILELHWESSDEKRKEEETHERKD